MRDRAPSFWAWAHSLEEEAFHMFNRTKGLLGGLAAFALVAAACGGGGGPAACQVTDTGGIDDKTFNQTAFAGVERAGDDFDLDAEFLESQTEADYEPHINSFLDEECEIIITVGFLLGEQTEISAAANPNQPFAIVDFAYAEPPANLRGLVFNTQEAAFLAGYVAAGMTQTGKVGTFGGVNIPPVTVFMDGFEQGVNYYNQQKGTSVEVLDWDQATQEGSFTGNFESLDDGRAFAQSLVDEGADIVMPVAGPVGLGSAALAADLGTDTLKIIGVDTDAYVADETNRSVYLTSVLKKMDNAVYDAVQDVVNGTFDNSLYVGTLANDGVGLGEYHDFDDVVPADLKAEVEQIKAAIIAGTITVTTGA